LSFFIGRPGIKIIGKDNVVAYENFVLQRYALANKRVARNLAAISNLRVLLNFHKRPNLHVVSDFTAVKVREIVNADVLAHPDACGNSPG
jgi:hypothetical protein